MVDDRAVGYPEPLGAEDAEQFIASLRELRAWSGQVSLRRLRTLGGSTTAASGDSGRAGGRLGSGRAASFLAKRRRSVAALLAVLVIAGAANLIDHDDQSPHHA